MARRSTPDARPWLADPPSNVRVTVVQGPRREVARHLRRIVRGALGLLAVAGLLALVAAAVTLLGGPSGSDAGAPSAGAPSAGVARADPLGDSPRDAVEDATGARGVLPAAVSAYRYPLGCLGITLSADRSAMLGRHSPCWHYGVYVTAVLRKVDGVWRLVLQATSRSCPAVVLPPGARSALAVCQRAAPPSLRNIP